GKHVGRRSRHRRCPHHAKVRGLDGHDDDKSDDEHCDGDEDVEENHGFSPGNVGTVWPRPAETLIQFAPPVKPVPAMARGSGGRNDCQKPYPRGRPVISMTGRISTVPLRAAGIREAIAIASSRSLASTRK